MKYGLVIIYSFFALLLHAQPKKLLLIDSTSKSPIEFASVYLTYPAEGSITNSDGIVKINFSTVPKEAAVKVSHISYEEKEYTVKALLEKDTIYLQPKVYSLREITISDFNLKERLEFILSQYNDLYIDYSLSRDCDYKEVFKANGNITRFIKADINWWSKSSAYGFGKSLTDFCNITLKNVAVSKAQNLSTVVNGKGALDTHDLISRLYLNYVLDGIIKNVSAFNITEYQQNSNEIKLSFETDETSLASEKKATVKFNGVCVFNKTTKALTYFSFNTLFSNLFYTGKGVEDTTVSYQGQTKSMSLAMSFINSIDDKKLSLSYMQLELNGAFNLENGEVFNVRSINNVYVTQERKQKRFKGNSIDFSKPIYKSIPNNEQNNHSIELSKEELNFIDGKE